jgi:hypothetical protein
MLNEPCIVSGGRFGLPARSFTCEPGVLDYAGVQALVRGAPGSLGFGLGHAVFGETVTFAASGEPAPPGCVHGTIRVTGDGGRCTIGPVVIGPEAFALLGAQAPAEAPVPVAPATLEERVQALEARVDALERRRA